MDFILSYNNNEGTMVFPVIVNGSVRLARAQKNPLFEGVNGQLQALGSMQLAEFTVESFFPLHSYPWVRAGSWSNGWRYVQTIREVRLRRIPFRAVYLDDSGREMFNLPVSAESFTYWLDEAGDISFRLDFREYRFAKTPQVSALGAQPLGESPTAKEMIRVETSAQAAERAGDGYVRLYTAADAVLTARAMYCAGAQSRSKTALACVAWVVCNRLDSGYGSTVYETVTARDQFAYRPDAPTVSQRGDDLKALAADVLDRWSREKAGLDGVGRVLPRDYLWFAGDGGSLYFRNAWEGGDRWDFSLPSPYAD